MDENVQQVPGTNDAHDAGNPASGNPQPKRKSHRRGGIIAGVVAAVVVVAGIGAFVWHEQPSFCNAICHTPMDGYLETYEATPGESATDKWGNQVDNAQGMLSAVHRVEDGDTCLSCHVPTLGEQIGEATAWASGNYTLVANDQVGTGASLLERNTTDLTAARGTSADSFCLNESCHNFTRADLTEMTKVESDNPAIRIRNPHSWKHAEQACTDCHKAHRASVLICTECHAEMEVPEGWISMQEAQALGYTA